MPSEEKQQKRNGSRMTTSTSSQQTLPLSHTPMKSHYYNVDNGNRHQMSPYENGNGYSSGQYANRYGNGKMTLKEKKITTSKAKCFTLFVFTFFLCLRSNIFIASNSSRRFFARPTLLSSTIHRRILHTRPSSQQLKVKSSDGRCSYNCYR